MGVTVRRRTLQSSRVDVLFVHNSFPGQFGFLANYLTRQGICCAAISSEKGTAVRGVPLLKWTLGRGTTRGVFNSAIRAEADLLRGRAAADCALSLQRDGLEPWLVIGHPGWGEMTLLNEVFPRAKSIAYGEYFYHSVASEVDFDPEFASPDIYGRFVVRAKNLAMSLAYASADRIVSPTPYQAGRLPAAFHDRLEVIHEGVDTRAVSRRPRARLKLPNGMVLDGSTPVVTFASRCLEPLRGYHSFLRSLPAVFDKVPDVQVVVIGGDSGGYGRPPEMGNWRQRFLEEVKDDVDLGRVHFTGMLPHDALLDAFSISWAHVYLTYPFVLSWSLLEAMASECLVIGSDTAPVRDVVRDGENGRLVDFFDYGEIADAIVEACLHPDAFRHLRHAARQTILDEYDREQHSKPAWAGLIEEVAGRSLGLAADASVVELRPRYAAAGRR